MDTLDAKEKRDKYFKGQQAQEEFICFFRHHWITLIKDFLLFAIFTGITIYAVVEISTIQEILRGNRAMKLFFYTGLLIGTIFYHRFFLRLLNFFMNVGIITDRRIIDHHKTLFFTDNMDSIDMAQIQNIERTEEGPLPSILKYGDIKVFLTASDTVKTFKGVPNAKFHFRCLNRQKEERQNILVRERGASMTTLGPLTPHPQREEIQQQIREVVP